MNALAGMPPPPRGVRRFRGYSLLIGRAAMLVPLAMVAVLFGRINVGTIRFLWWSEIVPAKVTKVTATPRERGPFYALHLAYRYGGSEYTRAVHVAPEEAAARKEGDIVAVQLLPERPDAASLFYPQYPRKFVTAASALFTVLPLAFLVKGLWDLLVAPWKLRRLLRQGDVAAGVIVGRREIAGRAAAVKLTYAFDVPQQDTGEWSSEAVRVQTSMWVPGTGARSAKVGDIVTVFYDPWRPKKSVVYECADYRITTPGPAVGRAPGQATD